MSVDGVNTNAVSSSFPWDSTTNSPQLMLALLEMKLAETNKASAMEGIKNIQDTNKEKELVAKLLNEARQKKADANSSGKCTEMSSEMVKYMDANKLAYDKAANDYKHDKDQWDVAITSLQSRLDSLGADTQTKMVQINDYMGQYNSYLQGANSQISKANDALTTIVRG
ncbi:MAG: USH1C-binding protein 1 [Desulfovibrio sp.]|nr:USH1C-binding protein 1 [Desulfovibrio sp.]